MAHPIAFISPFTIKRGKLDGMKLLAQDVASGLEVDKPQTLIFLIYLDDNVTQATRQRVTGVTH